MTPKWVSTSPAHSQKKQPTDVQLANKSDWGLDKEEKKIRPFLFGPRLSHFHNAKAWYDDSLSRQPRLTNFCVAITIASMANMSAQIVLNSASSPTFGDALARLDIAEMRALALTAALYNGIFLTTAFMALGRLFPTPGLKTTLCKLAIAQLGFQPFVYMPYFFIFHGLITGETLAECFAHLRAGYWPTLLRMWKLFCPMRCFMFAFVPVNYQVLWDLCTSFVWQVLLSLFNCNHQASELGAAGGNATAAVIASAALALATPVPQLRAGLQQAVLGPGE